MKQFNQEETKVVFISIDIEQLTELSNFLHCEGLSPKLTEETLSNGECVYSIIVSSELAEEALYVGNEYTNVAKLTNVLYCPLTPCTYDIKEDENYIYDQDELLPF